MCKVKIRPYSLSRYQDDHEGSVTHLTNATGAILERYRYDVFGAPSISNANGNPLTASAYNSRFMFTGREYTSTFGIYEYRARAYHPGLGRFTGEDPKGFDAGDYNLFRYCHNDPEDLTDAMGLAPVVADEESEELRNIADAQNYNSANNEHLTLSQRAFRTPMGTKSEWATSVWRDNQTRKVSMSQPRTDHDTGTVRPPRDAAKTTLSEHHTHMNDDRDYYTKSIVSSGDVRHGNWTGKVQEVMTYPTGLRARYLPSDAKTPEARRAEGGVIQNWDERRGWTNAPGSRTTGPWAAYRKGDNDLHNASQNPSNASTLSRVNPFGAFQSSPFGDDAEGAQAMNPHPVPRYLY